MGETELKKIGVFGGSFDPVHVGHLLLAEQCREQCQLDEVWFVPAATAPHKPSQAAASPQARLEMLQLAIGGHESFRASRVELDRGGVSYTVDTLAEIRRQEPQASLMLLMGSDSLLDLVNWREPRRICELATPVVVERGGGPAADFGPLAALVGEARVAEMRRLVVRMPSIEISSRDLRRRIAAGLSIRYQTVRAVEKYIETYALYRMSLPPE